MMLFMKHFMTQNLFLPLSLGAGGRGGVTECHTLCLLHNPHKGGYIICSVVRPWPSSNLFLRTWDYSFTWKSRVKTNLLFTKCPSHGTPSQREQMACGSIAGWMGSVYWLHLHHCQSSQWPLLTAVLESLNQAQRPPGEEHDMLAC